MPQSILPETIRITGSMMDWLFPPRCAACGSPLERAGDTICQSCWMALNESIALTGCPTCGKTTGAYELTGDRCHFCRDSRPVIDRTIRIGEYASPLKELIVSFKFNRQEHLDRYLGQLMASALSGRPERHEIDCFIPVPLHWRRKLARGYNQSDLLARALSAELKRNGMTIPVRHDLVRLKNTVPQAQLPAGNRRTNLRRAFALRYGSHIKDQTVCLVDDVTTTGATLNTTGRLLKRAGVKRVFAIVIAATTDTR